jgi:ornithine decarboxylase
MREGDYVEFGSLGAYGSATATRFNGYGVRELVEVA